MQGSGPGDRVVGEHERRCPECGALVSDDARWCGQCFRSLIQPVPEPEHEPASATLVSEPEPGPTSITAPVTGSVPKATPTWPCPACGNENPLELDVCEVCGTSFAAMMRQGEAPLRTDPKEAVRWSLIFPGLGHRKAGRGPDGLARGVLFALVLSMTILTGLSGLSTAVGVGIFVLYLVATVVVYVGSAIEASRIAQGGEPFISARQLLWVTVALILGSVALLALSVVFAARR
jgi:hypothetical protein